MRRSSRLVFAVLSLAMVPSDVMWGQEPQVAQSDRPAPSPDGQSIVYVSDVDGTRDIWITDQTGANNRAFVAWSSDERDPAWSADGNSVIFSSNFESTKHQIWRVASNGSNPIKLTTDDAEHESP